MKYYFILNIIFFVAAAVFSPYTAYAETNVNISNNGIDSKTSVDVKTNTGQNTICRNGECTTTESNNGKSTVCINGKCETADDGNINIKSENGNTTVNITNKGTSTFSAEKEKIEIKDQASRAAQDKKNEIKEQINEQINPIEKIFDKIREFFKSLNFF